MSAPAPTTPASPNKKKFSFKFPSVHDHEKHHERRNFSEEALSTSDLQVSNYKKDKITFSDII